ncbi:MAG: GTPase Era [Clostridia bacterium]|nr:GTPase Era [Clostridia bacterium]
MDKIFKSGFCAIVGMPNVGKSTLLNKLVGQKIAIISDKPQTTRNKILAIYNDEESQIVFTDTPGIHKPQNKLGEMMVKSAKETLSDNDLLIMVVDATRPLRETEKELARSIKNSGEHSILAINKVDMVKKDNLLPLIADCSNLNEFDAIVPLSAKSGDGVNLLINEIKQLLDEGPMYYYEDMVTDQPEKQIAAEIIREKMLWLLDKEIPHGIAIEIEKMQEKKNVTAINAVIYIEKDSHKGIVIGKGGEMLKKIGALARADIEEMLDKKVYLELWVRVKKDWRNNNYLLKNFGFTKSEE